MVRKLLLRHYPNQRISNDAVAAATELLRLFIVEARQRAAVEAECEQEVEGTSTWKASCTTENDNHNHVDMDDSSSPMDTATLNRRTNANNHHQGDDTSSSSLISIRADHIAKIAAELLMDFS